MALVQVMLPVPPFRQLSVRRNKITSPDTENVDTVMVPQMNSSSRDVVGG